MQCFVTGCTLEPINFYSPLIGNFPIWSIYNENFWLSNNFYFLCYVCESGTKSRIALIMHIISFMNFNSNIDFETFGRDDQMDVSEDEEIFEQENWMDTYDCLEEVSDVLDVIVKRK